MRKENLGLSKSELMEIADNYIMGFQCERNKQIFLDFETKGKTYEQIAEEKGMSVRQIKTIVKNCMFTLKHIIETRC